METTAALVLLDGASDLQFDYSVPPELTGRVVPGSRVRVPLRNRTATGTVVDLHPLLEEGAKFKLKPIADVIGQEPAVTPRLLELASWVSEYYLTSREAVLRAMLPQAVRKGGENAEKKQLAVTLLKEPAAEELEKIEKRAPRQAQALRYLLDRNGQTDEPLLLTHLIDSTGVGRTSVTALEGAGFVSVGNARVHRDPFANETFVESEALPLNEAQREAFDAIHAAIRDPENAKPILLYGVTGSGKTEVYLQAIQETLNLGKGAIVLVPEISLTPQTAERFKRRFAAMQDQVAILHSHLSEGERHDEWQKVLRREARIVIGARSAIFAPLDDLGLIIVDEEHENSYKQENPPRYQARDLAVVRAHLEKCPVVLGSATPSLESFHNACTGKYLQLDLPDRVDDKALPLIRVVDMTTETRHIKGKAQLAILSRKLGMEIQRRLDEGEQAILFLNRRGFARSFLCPECGYVADCQHCSVTLTYHREDERLICHVCGFRKMPPRRCPKCGDQGVLYAGYGTEKVEGLLKQAFPQARIARVDTDTMRRKNQLRDTLNAFKAKKIDLLLGTQMIAKGLHFPNVTLVGILNADIGLHTPDFRAGERTFQLLTQVAGRAGRGDVKGEVIIQTFTPHHPSIQFARHHDFTGYAAQELDLRRQFEYPPFRHVTLVTVRSAHQRRAEFSAETLHRRIKEKLPKGIVLNDPLPSPLEKAHGQFRYQMMLRCAHPRRIAKHLSTVLKDLSFPEDVIVSIDVDAYNLS